MGRNFDDTVTIPAATPTRLITLMIAKGFNMTPMAGMLSLFPSGDIYINDTNAVSPTTGTLLEGGTSFTEDASYGTIDLTQKWVYSAAGTTVRVKARGNG